MAHSRRFLERCQSLKEKGIEFEISQGSIVSRGFADLGFEEFAVLSSTKLVSLYTGNQSNYSENDMAHLFVVPTADMMVDLIIKRGYEIVSLAFIDQRIWRLEIKHLESKLSNIIEEDSLEHLWLYTLLSIKS